MRAGTRNIFIFLLCLNYLYYTKRPSFACENCIFPKTRVNKNKQWTHSPPLKVVLSLALFSLNCCHVKVFVCLFVCLFVFSLQIVLTYKFYRRFQTKCISASEVTKGLGENTHSPDTNTASKHLRNSHIR